MKNDPFEHIVTVGADISKAEQLDELEKVIAALEKDKERGLLVAPLMEIDRNKLKKDLLSNAFKSGINWKYFQYLEVAKVGKVNELLKEFLKIAIENRTALDNKVKEIVKELNS